MKDQIAYLKYVLRHRHFVYAEGRKLRVSPIQLFFHDMSKFSPTEWLPYVHFFYNKNGTAREKRDRRGYLKPVDTGDPKFEAAWFHHIKHNKHHWQYWYIPGHAGGHAVPIPEKYLREMVADWRGANRAQGGDGDIQKWYNEHARSLLLTDEDRYKVVSIIFGGG